MGTPVDFLGVRLIGSTSWLEEAQFRLRVRHRITLGRWTLWSWEEAYIAGEEELPGRWAWYRACDKTYITRAWILDALDDMLNVAIKTGAVERNHRWRGLV